MKIIVDAFGGDNAPLEIIKGAVEAKREYGVDILLVGAEDTIRKVAAENEISLDGIAIYHAPDVFTNNDSPSAIRTKAMANTSLATGFRLLKEGEGDAFLSAGNSGAIGAGSMFIVKRIKGVKRVAFAPVIPTASGKAMVIDSGINTDVRPAVLQQFAIMGSVYMNKVIGIENPRVGLANVGTEEHKGDELRQETYKLLQKTPVNFVGNIEGRDVPLDGADVVVCDGFTGNMIIKTYEGDLRGRCFGAARQDQRHLQKELQEQARRYDGTRRYEGVQKGNGSRRVRRHGGLRLLQACIQGARQRERQDHQERDPYLQGLCFRRYHRDCNRRDGQDRRV